MEFSGQRGNCPNCNSLVIGHKGKFKEKHWKHFKKQDCDSWIEPITEWHLSWQNNFPEEYREVIIEINNIKHRADIRLEDGLVIEIQNSPIKPEEIEAREKFYGENNMIWILNGETLCKRSFLKYEIIKKQFQVIITIPQQLKNFDKYDLDEYRTAILSNAFFKNILKKAGSVDIQNGYTIVIESLTHYEKTNFKSELAFIMESEFKKMYGLDAFQLFKYEYNIWIISEPHDRFDKIHLEKRNWRKFIDLFNFPIFIDNLNGLDENDIYWYQENRVYKKEMFINHYLNRSQQKS